MQTKCNIMKFKDSSTRSTSKAPLNDLRQDGEWASWSCIELPFKMRLKTKGSISPGDVSVCSQPLSESPLCFFTAPTETGSRLGCGDQEKKKKTNKLYRHLVAAAQQKLLNQVECN